MLLVVMVYKACLDHGVVIMLQKWEGSQYYCHLRGLLPAKVTKTDMIAFEH